MLPGSCWKGNASVRFSTRYGNMENGCVDKDLWSLLAGAECYSLSMWLSPSSIEVPTGFFLCAVQVILLRVVIAVLFSHAFEQENLHKQGTFSWLLNVFVNCPWACCVWSWTKLCLCVIGSSWQLCDVFRYLHSFKSRISHRQRYVSLRPCIREMRVGASKMRLWSVLEHLWASWGRFRGVLEVSWRRLAATWRRFGASYRFLSDLNPSWRRPGGDFETLGNLLEAFCRRIEES